MSTTPEIPLIAGEQVVWSHEIMQGIIHRHPEKVLAITNLRAVIYDVQSKGIASADIRNVIVTIMNERRESQGLSYGTYYSGAARFGQFDGVRYGESHSIGDVSFIENGRVVMKWGGLNDPHGIARLVEGIQKSWK